MRLVTPIAPSPATPLPIEPQSTVRLRAQRCLTTADEPQPPGNRPVTLTERELSQRSLLRTSPKAIVCQRAKQRHPAAPTTTAPRQIPLPKILPLSPIAHEKCRLLLPIAHEFSFNYQEKLNNSLTAPIAPSPTTPLPDEPQSTVHQRAKQCLTTADELHAPDSLAERAFSQRSPASKAMLPEYAALRYTLIINYPPPQLIAHQKIFPASTYCPTFSLQ